MKSSNYIIPFALGALFVSCNGKADENADTAVIEEDEVAVVEVDVAHQRSVDLHREYTANVEADNVNNISPAVSNRIQSITVDVGDNVHKGQVLATLDPANADQQRINLEQAERDYNRAVNKRSSTSRISFLRSFASFTIRIFISPVVFRTD